MSPFALAGLRTPQPTSVQDMIPHWLPTREHCQSVFTCKSQLPLPETEPAFLQLMQEGLASVPLEWLVAGGIFLGVCTWWLHGWTKPRPLISDGATKFRLEWKGRSSTVPTFIWPDTIAKLQLAHNFKCQEFTLAELRQRKINQSTITEQPPKCKWMLWNLFRVTPLWLPARLRTGFKKFNVHTRGGHSI